MKLILAMLLAAVANTAAEHLVHVAADAGPGGTGGETSPWQTLEQARDGIRSARRAGRIRPGDAVTVLIRPGIYELDRSFELTAEDGGSARAPVVYRASLPRQVHLRGGTTLDAAAFKPIPEPEVAARLDPAARARVVVCDVSAIAARCGGFRQLAPAYKGVPAGPWLHADGQLMPLARWPDASAPGGGWAEFSITRDTGLPQPDSVDPALRKPHPGSFVLGDPRPARWDLDAGVWLMGYWTHDWSDEVIRIAAYDKGQKTITLAAPHGYGINAGTWGASKRRIFALNVFEELDAPGEWYLDRARNLLYFIPPAPLARVSLVLATLEQPLVRVTGASHIRFEGMVIGFSHGDAVVVHHSSHVEINGCVIANAAGSGIAVDGTGNVVRSCDVFNLGKGGIALYGGDRRTLTPANNQAANNHIHHYGIFQRTYAAGLGVGGCGQVARHNRIHDAPHNAVLYGGNEHLFELNEIYRVVLETGDAGAFYTGRDWTSQGNVLRHNFIHDLGAGDAGHVNTMGVYLDDCDCGDTIEGNVFLRAGRAIMIGGGRDNPVIHNMVIDCPIGIHIDSRGMKWKQWNNPDDPSWWLEDKARKLNYTEPPWQSRYPRLAAILRDAPREPKYNPIRGNVFAGCTKAVCDFDAEVVKRLDPAEVSGNLVVPAGTTAAATAAGITGFTVIPASPAGSPALGLAVPAGGPAVPGGWQSLPGFPPVPFDRIGLVTDAFRESLPPR